MDGIFYDDWKVLTEARNVKSVYVNIATTMIYAEVSRANVKNNHRKCIV